jgi:hypothetical protein
MTILGGFAICGLFLVIAFATGRAYYLLPMLYVERSNTPIAFWLVVILWAAILAIGVAFAVTGRW